MGVNASKARFLLDTAAAVTLRNIADGAEAATATETAISLSELDLAYWQDGNEIPHGLFVIQVNVTARVAGGTNAYTLSLLVDDVSAMNDSPVTIASYSIPSTGIYTFVVDSKTIPKLDADSSGTDKFLAIRATIAGDTSPSITYGAHIAKSLHH